MRSLFEDPRIQETKNALIQLRRDHFSAKSASQKIRLREKDDELRQFLAELLRENDLASREDAEQLARWNPYDQNASSEFFSSEWMFNVNDGFDIVIGNPPYIQLQNNGGELSKLYQPCGYGSYSSMGDIYCLFYERGWQLFLLYSVLYPTFFLLLSSDIPINLSSFQYLHRVYHISWKLSTCTHVNHRLNNMFTC